VPRDEIISGAVPVDDARADAGPRDDSRADATPGDAVAHDDWHDAVHRETEVPDWLHGDRVTDPSGLGEDGGSVFASLGMASSSQASADALSQGMLPAAEERESVRVQLQRVGEELWAWFKTLTAAGVYATLIVTFGVQVARVERESMAPTLQDQDRLIVN